MQLHRYNRPLHLRRWAIGTVLSVGLGLAAPSLPAKAADLFPADRSAVHNPRSLAVPEAGVEIFLWDEQNEDGTFVSYVAVAGDDGQPRGRTRRTSNQVELEGLSFDPLLDGEPRLAPALRAKASNRLFLVQLHATPLPELQKLISDAGATIHRFYTQKTLLVEMDAAAKADVEALAFVRWVGPYHPAYRVEPVLRQSLDGSGPERTAQRYSIMLIRRGKSYQQALATTIASLGAETHIFTEGGFRMEATLTQQQLATLAQDDRVHYIDRWGGPMETDMDIVRAVGGGDYVETQGNFTGQGVRAEVIDSELRVTHQEWATAPIIHNPSGIATGGVLHGTSSTSNVFAAGTNAPARGMIPDAQPIFFLAGEASNFGGSVSRYTANAELIDPAGPYQAVFQTSSVGNSRTLSYTTLSAETDDYLFLHQLLSTQSQSNAGTQNSRPQAWAKNIVSVGGIRHQGTATRSDDRWSFGASIGPAADGRIKPDLAFFYDSIFSASGSTDTSYTSFGGTSSATPQTGGHFGLLFQMWHQGLWAGHGGAASVFASRPHMATAKALMIHHAHRYDWNAGGSNSDLDRFKQGWGTADLTNLFNEATTTRVIDETEILAPLGSYSTTVTITAGAPELKATLVYADPMGTVGAGVHRINDLSLKVTSPSATVYWGNNGLTADNFSTSGGVSNTLDTVENVFVPSPETGVWTIEVFADVVVQDSHTETAATDADFALVLSPVTDNILFLDGFESGNTTSWDATVSP